MHNGGQYFSTNPLFTESSESYFYAKHLIYRPPALSHAHHSVNPFQFHRTHSQALTTTASFLNGQGIPRRNIINRKQYHVRAQPRLRHMSREMWYPIIGDWYHGIGSAASM